MEFSPLKLEYRILQFNKFTQYYRGYKYEVIKLNEIFMPSVETLYYAYLILIYQANSLCTLSFDCGNYMCRYINVHVFFCTFADLFAV